MKTRPRATAIEENPVPTSVCQRWLGPSLGHLAVHPVSFEIPFKSGPRHRGQSLAEQLKATKSSANNVRNTTGRKKTDAESSRHTPKPMSQTYNTTSRLSMSAGNQRSLGFRIMAQRGGLSALPTPTNRSRPHCACFLCASVILPVCQRTAR